MMDWRSRSTRKLLGKVVTVQVDRPVGYLHGDILYPVNYGFVPGLMGGDGEEQDAYILGLLENSPYQHSSQCHPALATKNIKKRLQPG